MVQQQLEIKLIKILDRILDAGCRQTTDGYYEMIITHLSKNEKSDNSILLRSRKVHKWIHQSIRQFNSDYAQRGQVFAFTLNLLALVLGSDAHDEFLENISLQNDILSNIIIGLKKSSIPSVKLGFVRVAKALLNHKAHHLEAIDLWKFPADFILENRTVYVVREAQDFLKQLLLNCHECADWKKSEILKYLINPLTKYANPTNCIIPVDKDDLQRTVLPTVLFLYSLLNGISLNESAFNHNHLLNIIFDELNVEDDLWKLTKMTIDQSFTRQIMNDLVQINIVRFGRHSDIENRKFFDVFLKQIDICIEKEHLNTFLTVINLYLQCDNIRDQPLMIDGIPFTRILFDFLISPIQYLTVEQIKSTILPESKYQHQYNKLLAIFGRNERGVVDAMIYSIQILKDLKSQITFENAVEVIRILIDVMGQKKPNISALPIIVGIGTMTEQHFKRIATTTEILEPLLIDISANRQYYFNSISGDMRFTVHIIKFLILLVDNISTENELCRMKHDGNQRCARCQLYQCLESVIGQLNCNIDWAIKDSIVELLTKLTSKALIHKVLEEMLLANTWWFYEILNMAKNDPEPFVRASALKCLHQMIRIPMLLTEFDVNNFTLHLLKNTKTECEAIVRTEVVNILRQMYECHMIGADLLDRLYSTIAICAVSDLHWEVQIAAIDFWYHIFQKLVQQAGLQRNNFTSYEPFADNNDANNGQKSIQNSREDIERMLNNISELRIFRILIECTKDDCDIIVIRKAVEIIENIVNVLTKEQMIISDHHSQQTDENVFDLPKPFDEITLDDHHQPILPVSNCSIMESVLDANDIDLFSNYAQCDGIIDSETKYCTDPCAYKKIPIMHVGEFLTKAKHLNRTIYEKSKWIDEQQELNSLLDDVMCVLKMVDINNMECY